MTVRLNRRAVSHARKLIESGDVVRDERDGWADVAPTADQENRFLDRHGWGEYSKWFLGVDSEKSEHTKERYSFPYGDLKKVRRGGVIAAESRAAQFDHDDIAAAAKRLLAAIDPE